MTMIDRRQFIQAAAGSALLYPATQFLPAGAAAHRFELTARPGSANLLEDGSAKTAIWGFDGKVPGPVLRVKRNQPVTIAVHNKLDQPTSVHWHGIRIDNAMDGVAGLTQEPIAPNHTFEYRFTAPDAGTYWYHPHNRTWEQLARGLYGALIVEEDVPLAVHRDYVLAADDWRLERDGTLHEASLGHMMDWSHAGRLGNILTLNGKPYERLTVRNGERVRLRLINTSNARVMRFGIKDVDTWIIAIDGQPIDPVRAGKQGVQLAPAQRADIVVDITAKPGEEIPIAELSGEDALAAGYLVCEAGAPNVPVDLTSTPMLHANPLPLPEAEPAQSIDLIMTGGAMAWLQSAQFKGQSVDGRTLAREHRQFWAFNGTAGMAPKPLFEAASGETVKIRMENQTMWPHGIHLHGHHFKILSRTGGRTRIGEPDRSDIGLMRDTVLLEAEETAEVALKADNPGKWMLHCHMLEHQAAGMGTWFLVRP